MALSQSTNFTMTAEELIRHALRKLKVIKGDQPRAKGEHLRVGMVDLNLLLKSLPTMTATVWKAVPAKLALVKHKSQYRISSYASGLQTQKFITHAIAAASTGDTTVSVAGATTDFAVSDPIDLYLNDGSIHSTTISGGIGAISGGVSFTIADALDADMDIRGQAVTWTDETRIPVAVSRPVYRDETDSHGPADIPMHSYSQAEYQDLSAKRTDGAGIALYFEKRYDDAIIHLWPEPDNASNTVRFIAHMPLDDIDADTNNVDLRPELFNAIVYMLAAQMGDSLADVDPNVLDRIVLRAEALADKAFAADEEMGSFTFSPRMK